MPQEGVSYSCGIHLSAAEIDKPFLMTAGCVEMGSGVLDVS